MNNIQAPGRHSAPGEVSVLPQDLRAQSEEAKKRQVMQGAQRRGDVALHQVWGFSVNKGFQQKHQDIYIYHECSRDGNTWGVIRE